MTASEDVATILVRGPVIPVVTLARVADALPLADALLAGGVSTIEITLRTPIALAAIAAIARARPELAVGAGTCLDPADFARAWDAGAAFLVSPGGTPALVEAAHGLPWLPGAATVAEAMRLREAGFVCLKLFPAMVAGGAALLRAIGTVLPDLSFCPTGGVGPRDAPALLALANVACVGGSWLTPPDVLEGGDWARVTTLARAAATL